MAEPIGAIAEIVLFVVGGPVAFWFGAHAYFEKRLGSNAGYRSTQIETLHEPKIARIYQRALDGGLRFLDLLMGKPELRQMPRAFGVCVTLALAYSFLFLVMAWGLFDGAGSLGETELLPDWSRTARLLTTAAIVLYMGTLYYISQYLGRWAVQRGAVVLAVAVVFSVALAVAVAGAVVVRLGVAGAFGVAVALAAGVAGFGVGVGAGAFGAVALAIAGAVAATGAVVGAMFAWMPLPNAVVVLFWVVLPFGNGFWDAFSWWVSRDLGLRLLQTVRDHTLGFGGKLVRVTVHVGLDLGLTLAFLVLLAATLPRLVEWWNGWTAPDIGYEPFPLAGTNGYLCQAARDPWGEGSWAMLMLASTLVPTALHALMALTSPLAVLALRWQGAPEIATRLATIPDDYVAGNDPRHAATIDEAAAHLTKAWVGVGIAVCVVLGGGWYLVHAGLLGMPAWLDQAVESMRWFLLRVALWDADTATACLALP